MGIPDGHVLVGTARHACLFTGSARLRPHYACPPSRWGARNANGSRGRSRCSGSSIPHHPRAPRTPISGGAAVVESELRDQLIRAPLRRRHRTARKLPRLPMPQPRALPKLNRVRLSSHGVAVVLASSRGQWRGESSRTESDLEIRVQFTLDDARRDRRTTRSFAIVSNSLRLPRTIGVTIKLSERDSRSEGNIYVDWYGEL